MSKTTPIAEAATLNETLSSQATSGLINPQTASDLWSQYEKIADQRFAEQQEPVATVSKPNPALPQPATPKTPADLYKESLFLQVERGDMKFSKAVSMWEAYQEKEQKKEQQKQQRRAEVLSTPVAQPGLGKQTDYKPQNSEQYTIYRNLKDMADRGLIAPKLAEAAWANYAKGHL